ncbi:GlxA family transcriptional regulator [Sulfitobacter aestuariivivens]
MACLTSMIEPLRAANEISQQDHFAWRVISEDGGKVTSSARVVFDADVALDGARDIDLLMVLASPVSSFADPRKGNGALRRMARGGLHFGAVSGGVFQLARAGLLEGHRASVHWCYDAAFRAEFPDLEVDGNLIVTDRRCHTVSGSDAAFDLSLRLIEAALGPRVSYEVACWFQHPVMRGDGVQQAIPLHPTGDARLPDLVARAIALFSADLEAGMNVNDVAAALGVTPRQVERSFKSALGQSPLHYFRQLRMKAARQMVLYTRESVEDIAFAVGYATATPLNRHYKTAFGLLPSQDRAQINTFRVEGSRPLPNA